MPSGYKLTRRAFLKLGGSALVGTVLGASGVRLWGQFKQPRAQVAILKAPQYTMHLEEILRRGLLLYPGFVQRLRGARVLLKPNLIEYYDAHRVNTHPLFVAGVIAALRSLGAGEIIVGEGPGHRRDTEALLELSGLQDVLEQMRVPFVDLNLDATAPVPLVANHTGLGQLHLPRTVLQADMVISLPKLKTHHWAGVTLSMKNLFGVVPGARYGWPKNLLHWRGIANSVVDITLAVRPAFAIVDGIEGMEGDGPLYGDTVHAGVVIMGESLSAVDATATRVMGFYPEHINYLVMMLAHGGTLAPGQIQQLGERLEDVRLNFRVLDYLRGLKSPLPWINRWVLGEW